MTRRISVLIVLFALAPATFLQADYRDAYRKGIQAAERRRPDWPAIERSMRDAIKEEPQESSKRVNIAGSRWKEYIPHYYLALALARQGHCEEAIREWDVSEKHAVITKPLDEYRDLQAGRRQCEAVLVAAAKTREPAKPTPAPATPTPEVTPVAPPPARSEPKARPEAKASADQNTDIGRAGGTGTRTDANPRPQPPAPQPPATQPPPAQPAPPSTRPLPDSLLRAATLFFRGQYGESSSVLNGIEPIAGPAAAQVSLFRAASFYSLYLIRGEKDDKLRNQAAAAVRECRQSDPALSPDRTVFSPRFVQFYDSIR